MRLKEYSQIVSEKTGIPQENVLHDYRAFFKAIKKEFADRELVKDYEYGEFKPIKIVLSGLGTFHCTHKEQKLSLEIIKTQKRYENKEDQTGI